MAGPIAPEMKPGAIFEGYPALSVRSPGPGAGLPAPPRILRSLGKRNTQYPATSITPIWPNPLVGLPSSLGMEAAATKITAATTAVATRPNHMVP